MTAGDGGAMITVRPAHTVELAEVGDLTVRAYVDGVLSPDDGYVHHLRDAVTRAREAELYVALVDGALAGTVTFCPQGSPWGEIAQPGEGEFRMLAVDPDLPEGRTSVGTRVQLEHVGASAVGAVVRVTATVAYVDGRLVRFEVAAEQDPDGRLVAHGEVTRVVVDRERFLARLG